ncbi:glycerate kinase [Halobacillus halophilus]|uniref:glycerate kinase family protein n=1 Tax=Halobacillus halophilus TaxID=1570 RepID=UPI0013717918|nr:glycerate kinase [Halobacillus halophilus]MYL28779.1 glycerate kinase [Halobacillus halophilus]
MKCIIAPDSYKGSLTAVEAAQSMEKGVRRVCPSCEVLSFPLADGGEGTVESLVRSTEGAFRTDEVTGPLGEKVKAVWGILGDRRTAVIEMAEASGITLLAEKDLNPYATTTFGTGELIGKALDYGVDKVILGIGGSATNDGGAGMAAALGAELLDKEGRPLPHGGKTLLDLHEIRTDHMDKRIFSTQFITACDVDNPLCGPRGASAVFGPQKGATPEMVEVLDQALSHYGKQIHKYLKKDIMFEEGAGAAGGLGAGLMAFLNAELKQGIDIVLDSIDFNAVLKGADFVLTGEGKTDRQTLFGKAPMGVGMRAKQFNVPVFCISGSLSDGYTLLEEKGIHAFFSISHEPSTLEYLSSYAGPLVEETVENIMKVYASVYKNTPVSPLTNG